jgi:subtilisin family serine protease
LSPTSPWRKRALAAVATAGLVGSGLLVATQPAQADHADTTARAAATLTAGRYIVRLDDAPVATYRGNVHGLAATRPAPGEKVSRTATAVTDYRSFLASQRARVLKAGGVSKTVYSYTYAFNGFSADLSADQAQKLAHTAGVVSVTKQKTYQVDTVQTPHYLNLTGPNGLWAKVGGVKGAGKGIIVGDIDTGLWPENPAFTGKKITVDGSGNVKGIPGWKGVCTTGPGWTTANCTKKVVGARFYTDGFGESNISPDEYLSPRDGAGHGSHTASTAAGNHGQNVVIDGASYGKASGMAPAAMIAVYKVCWEGKENVAAGCAGADLVAAIDDAVADGVDVINFSIGGADAGPFDPVELAFLGAADAGVFVAASAGNSGPAASTLDHSSPWVTTVAASTTKINEATVQLGNGKTYVGASITAGLSATPAVLSSAVGLSGADADEVRLCFAGTLDPAKAAGKVVVCDRGSNARIEKGFEVQRAGGLGMIMVNTSPNSLNADIHPIPTVHVNDVDGAAIKAYVSSAAHPTAAILADVNTGSKTKVPEVADFSSRGPSLTTGGDILKPDLAAPGVDVIAAVAPPFNYGRSWDAYSGTSMSSPHVAGVAALLKSAHPTWSPAAIKSALMTTARDHVSTTDPFAQGAGFIQPNLAEHPGLVLDANTSDWLRFLDGECDCVGTGAPISGSELNQASVGIGELVNSQSVTRTFTNVSGSTRTYGVTVSGLSGIKVKVSPATFTIKPGKTKTVKLTFTRTSAALGEWSSGFLTWKAEIGSRVRIPVAVKPEPISAPSEVSADITANDISWDVTPGFSGALDASVFGLAAATPVDGSVADDLAFNPLDPAASAGAKPYDVTVPAGSTLVRFDTNALDDADLDLYVTKDGQLVDYSATGSGDEQVTLSDPEPGTYTAWVVGYDVGTDGTAPFVQTNYVVGASSLGNATVALSTATATSGKPITVTLTPSGLDPSKRYLGWVGYATGGDDVGQTVVAVG